jgi:ABC-2 type transport system ATP-binding protein
VGGDRLEVIVRRTAGVAEAAGLLARVTGAEPEIDVDQRRVSAPIQQRLAVLVEALRAFEEAGIEVEDLALRKPTLDEAFLHLTGRHAARDEEAAA